MVENLCEICEKQLELPYSRRENGIQIPKRLRWRAHPKRVLLHPMSADEKKNWPFQKFIKLGHLLQKEGFEPSFCVSPQERELWKTAVAIEQLPLFPTVSDLAAWVYESGYLIGNDSGIGHLASLFHIPTLSLFARKSYSCLWRPGWGPGAVVTPPNLLIGSRLKQKYWKQMLSVGRVLKRFRSTREER